MLILLPSPAGAVFACNADFTAGGAKMQNLQPKEKNLVTYTENGL